MAEIRLHDDEMTTREIAVRGEHLRRQVLGDAYVDASKGQVDTLSAPLQDLITRYCWGEIWARPGLDMRTRSFLNLAMMAALGRPEELVLHTRGAIRNGITEEEIAEVIAQAAIYCGVPAALDALRAVRHALKSEVG
jgi:4-carboxymuconolactone decarboxylase